jgi:hypothetical protein
MSYFSRRLRGFQELTNQHPLLEGRKSVILDFPTKGSVNVLYIADGRVLDSKEFDRIPRRLQFFFDLMNRLSHKESSKTPLWVEDYYDALADYIVAPKLLNLLRLIEAYSAGIEHVPLPRVVSALIAFPYAHRHLHRLVNDRGAFDGVYEDLLTRSNLGRLVCTSQFLYGRVIDVASDFGVTPGGPVTGEEVSNA